MKHAFATLILVSVVVLGAAILPAFAQQYPVVANLKAFSAEANFMSLPGYFRWVVFQQTDQWLSLEEATRIVNEQIRSAGQ